ncbi:MAG: DUF4276 family protein [Candidatus Omnitrophota bacterium]
MIRLHIIAEGQTEETFVNFVLVNYLGHFGVVADARCVETSRKRRRIYRGGLLDYPRAKRDILRWMNDDQNDDALFTTMFDLYALPPDFPGYKEAKKNFDPYRRVEQMEEAMGEDISSQRFIPYIQLHEFEALILADPRQFEAQFPNRIKAIKEIGNQCASFSSPELIDDGNNTAPSKRIIQLLPEYYGMKASAGPLIAQKIGLPLIREKCPHFHSWLTKIESLSKANI